MIYHSSKRLPYGGHNLDQYLHGVLEQQGIRCQSLQALQKLKEACTRIARSDTSAAEASRTTAALAWRAPYPDLAIFAVCLCLCTHADPTSCLDKALPAQVVSNAASKLDCCVAARISYVLMTLCSASIGSCAMQD